MTKVREGGGGKARNPAARLAFFARKEEIAQALESGVFMKAIFVDLKLPGSYQQFTRYVHAYLRKPTADQSEAASTASPAPAKAASVDQFPAATGGRIAVEKTSGDSPTAPREGPLRARAKPERPIYDPSKIKPEDLY